MLRKNNLILIGSILLFVQNILSHPGDSTVFKKNIIGFEIIEFPERYGANVQYISYLYIEYSRIVFIKKNFLSLSLGLQSEKYIYYSRLYKYNQNYFIANDYKDLIHKINAVFDIKAIIKQKLFKQKKLFLYEGIGCNAIFPLNETHQIILKQDSFSIQNNQAYFQKSEYNFTSEKRRPYYREISDFKDLSYYLIPHINTGILVHSNALQFQLGFNLYFLINPFNLYPQDKVLRLNLAIWF